MRQSRFRRLLEAFVAVTVAAGCGGLPNLAAQDRAGPPPSAQPLAGPVVQASATAAAPAPPAETLRLTRNIPGDSTPIVVAADDADTWLENGQRIVVVRGQVLIQEGVVQFRAREAVCFVDLQAGVMHMDVYAEGDVQIDNSAAIQSGQRALISLSTRGEFRLRAYKNKVRQQALADDPLVQRGRAERGPSAPAPAAAPAKPAADAGWPSALPQRPADAAPPLLRTSYEAPAPPDSPPPAAVVPGPPQAPGPGPATPLPPPSQPAVRPPAPPPPPGGPPRQFSVAPRGATGFHIEGQPLGNGEQAVIVTGGVLVTVSNVPGVGLLDVEADRLVVWTKGADAQQLITNLQDSKGQSTSELELYLSGNVEIRQSTGPEMRILRADEVYYDVNHNVAVALNAQLQLRKPGMTDDLYVRADRLLELSATKYQVYRAELFSSKLPSDPGLLVYVADATIEDVDKPKYTLFGTPVVDPKTGKQETTPQSLVEAHNAFFELEHVPFFYLPYLAGDARDPLGPVQSVNLGYNRVYGVDFGVGLNVYQLLGLDPIANTHWSANVDYLSRRGPGVGTQYDFAGKELFGVPAKYSGFFKGYAMDDKAYDILGGGRETFPGAFWPPDFRGRAQFRENVQDMPYGFSVQTQLYALSDHNFLEAYYPTDFRTDVNAETFLYVKQQPEHENWAWTALAQPNVRDWVTETEALPRVDGRLIGESFLDHITYNAWGGAGYFHLLTTSDPQPRVSPTDRDDATGRFHLMQELAAPLDLGPVKVVPYAKLLLAEYTNDLDGDETGRIWGGGGVRASIPFTRIYPDVQSELFNVNGINHKIVASADYFVANANEPYTRYPQLDRLNDDASDQALRDIRPQDPTLYPGVGKLLATSPLYDPQIYAIRRLIDDRIDTLDQINELTFDVRQRWQTKRGFPGDQHIVDWMTLDLSGSYFPEPNHDNFGQPFAFLQYDYIWNIGDLTALTSSGWVDPIPNGARVFTLGAYMSRPDRTSFFLGYREIQPIDSRAITGSVSYVLSPKYAVTASSTYDFGNSQALSNTLVFTRMGKDLQVSVGITYNALTNSVGALFEIVPNLVPPGHNTGPLAAGGPGGLLGH